MQDRIATVVVDGRYFTGTVYHVRENGWPCVMTTTGGLASGPEVEDGQTQPKEDR